jgi:tight adherence protein C
MSPVLLVAVLIAGAMAAAAWVRYTSDDTAVNDEAFAAARRQFDGPLDAGMLRLARPIAQTRAVRQAASNPSLRTLRERVVASGSYGGDFDVFLACQVAALLVASGVMLAALAVSGGAVLRLVVLALGAAVAIQPYSRVSSAARRRGEEVNEDMPDFVDLLLMPISSGMSPEAAMRFTVQHIDGPTATACRWLLDTLQSRTMNEELAFREAGRRLGTPEAAAFFTALGQAHIEGARVVDTLNRQADALRTTAHQIRRARVKRVPVKMIVAFAMHFLPLLFVLVMIPLLVGLKSVG